MLIKQVNQLLKDQMDGEEEIRRLSSRISAVLVNEGLASTFLQVEMEVTSYVTVTPYITIHVHVTLMFHITVSKDHRFPGS